MKQMADMQKDPYLNVPTSKRKFKQIKTGADELALLETATWDPKNTKAHRLS